MTAGQLSKRGAGLCASFEAIYLYAYPDPGTGGEPVTIGIGHTRAAGSPAVRLGDKITLARAFEIYATDMLPVQIRVRRAIKHDMTPSQFDAVCSFELNTGAILSGTVDDKMNAGDVDGAIAAWKRYDRAGGKVMRGLQTRRAEEIALFRTGVYPSRKILLRETPSSIVRQINPDSIPWGGTASPVAVVDLDRPLVAAPARPPVTGVWAFLRGMITWLM